MSISTDESRGCENGEVRLQGGVDPSDGHVEFCVDRVWGRICSDGWDVNDTRVVCQQLGFDPEGMCISTVTVKLTLQLSCSTQNH